MNFILVSPIWNNLQMYGNVRLYLYKNNSDSNGEAINATFFPLYKGKKVAFIASPFESELFL